MAKKDKKDKKDKGKGKGKSHHGILIAVDVSAMSLSLREKGRKVDYLADPVSVEVSINKADAEFADLEVGMNCFLVLGDSGTVIAIDARKGDDSDDAE